MPTARGRKQNQPPRKRKKAKHPSTNDLFIIPIITDQQHTSRNVLQNSQLQHNAMGQDLLESQPTPNCQNIDCGFVKALLPQEQYQQNFERL